MTVASSGCGFYFKTYRFKGPSSFSQGMNESDVLKLMGSPLSVQPLNRMQVWRYFSEEPVYGKKKTYTLVWFQDGKVVKWETTEEDKLPPQPAS